MFFGTHCSYMGTQTWMFFPFTLHLTDSSRDYWLHHQAVSVAVCVQLQISCIPSCQRLAKRLWDGVLKYIKSVTSHKLWCGLNLVLPMRWTFKLFVFCGFFLDSVFRCGPVWCVTGHTVQRLHSFCQAKDENLMQVKATRKKWRHNPAEFTL